MYKIIVLLSIFIVSFSSCETLTMKDDPENSPISNFENLWNTVDQKYSFFEDKNIDWDSIYTHYRSEIYDDIPEKELFDIFSEMLFALRDGHVNIISTWNVSRNWDWMLDYPANFNITNVERNYLGKDYFRTGPLQNQVIDSVGYIYYESFSSGINSTSIDNVIERFKNFKGIIIDVRGNGGGTTGNVTTFVSRFTTEKYQYGSFKQKSGPQHSDFSELSALSQDLGGDYQYTGPVVVLTNRGCYSATNDFVNRMKVLPNVTIMGDNTGGGGGFPIYCELPNGWRYRFSSTISYDLQGNNIEFGIEPDIRVELNPVDEANGVDTMIEAALDFIRMK